MLAARYLFVALSLLVSLVAAAPIPTNDPVAAAKKSASEAKEITKQLDLKLSPPRDKAIFWSGHVNGKPVSAMDPATTYGKKKGKETLEMSVEKAGIKIPDWGTTKESAQLWSHASKLWAERSKGEVEAFVGQTRPKSVWNTVEKSILQKNTKVTKVIEHDLSGETPKAAAGKGENGGHKAAPAAPHV